ncbi:MAG: hypothetical protein IJ062_06200 [Firmicutes bacterium]|nr:hypothetical protein [Bacillota bacterium]
MKKIFCALIIFSFIGSLSGCGYRYKYYKQMQQNYNNQPVTPVKPANNIDYTSKYTIVADHGEVRRAHGEYDDNLTWVVTFNGETMLERNAVDEFKITPSNYGDGRYKVWLKAYTEYGYERVSNIVEWDMPFDENTQVSPNVYLPEPIVNTDHVNEYTLTEDKGCVTRSSGSYEDSLTWVIEVNGRTVLERNAENEFTYRPTGYEDGVYKVWLESFIDGGYKRVSNIAEWTQPLENVSAEESDIIERKNSMKSLIRKLDHKGEDLEYKMGFVIDADHDGEYDNCAFYAGKDKAGNEAQFIFENGSSFIRFSTMDIQEENTLYIWCDEATGKDYIIRAVKNADGSITGTDCCTGEVIYTQNNDEITVYGQKADKSRLTGYGRFSYNSEAPYDCDHFYVSKNGKAVFESA